jgi:hypothetical protein
MGGDNVVSAPSTDLHLAWFHTLDQLKKRKGSVRVP